MSEPERLAGSPMAAAAPAVPGAHGGVRPVATPSMTLAPAPPPPPSPGGAPRFVFDGGFVGPMLPPPAPAPPRPAVEPATEAVLAIPLGTRKLVGHALDLLTRSDAGLRSASFYIGFLVLVTIAPIAILLGVAVALEVPLFDPSLPSPLDGPILVAMVLAIAGYVAAGVESRALATAVIGGRAEGRPLQLRESIVVARRRFWHVLGANVIVGLTAGMLAAAIQLPVGLLLGNVEAINYGLSLVIGTLVGAPFAYVAAGIVLGEVDAAEAVRRSVRLARARKRLAVVVALFSILSQFVVLFGVSIGGDVVLRLVDGTGIAETFPPELVIPVAAALVFAFGTLLFLVEAITAAPAVYAFIALTRYTRGLQVGRVAKAGPARPWNPWISPGMALGITLAVVSLVAGLAGVTGRG